MEEESGGHAVAWKVGRWGGEKEWIEEYDGEEGEERDCWICCVPIHRSPAWIIRIDGSSAFRVNNKLQEF